MSEKKLNINYTGADIQKYLEGKLSASEMHAIEKAALTDPFLSDAIEGMSAVINKGELNRFISETDELKKVIQRKRNNLSIIWKAAAVLIIIVTGIAIIFIQTKTNSKSAEILATTKILPKDRTEAAGITKDSNIQISPAPEPGKNNNHINVKPSVPAAEVIENEKEDMLSPGDKDREADTQSLPEPAKALSNRAPGIDIPEKKKQESKIITTTDTLNSYDEVIITGYSASKRKMRRDNRKNVVDFTIKHKPLGIEPETGWKEYSHYINENKIKDTVNPEIRSTVIISFLLDTDGRPQDLAIESGRSKFYNEQAVKLINNGPKWKSSRPSSERIRVRIGF